MLGFSSLKTTKKDFQICLQSIVKSFKFLHHLILSNSLFIALTILIEASYFYYLHKTFEQAPGETPEMIMETYHILATSLFSVLQWTFLVFLVPFQLHTKYAESPSAPVLSFKIFLKENMWPLVIETMRAFFSLLLYFVCGAGAALGITAGVSALLGGASGESAGFFSALFQGMSIMALVVVLFIICLLPAMIKFIQYLFVPYVVFFSKKFKASGKSLKISSHISQGAVIPIAIVGILSTLLFRVLGALAGISWEKTLFQFTPHVIIIGILLQLFYNILSTAFIHFMYIEKANSYDENNRSV